MAKEELDKMAEKAYAKDIQYIGMSANITYKLGFKAGYDKANEWHYPSKGEYPKDEKRVLCILGDFENDNIEVGYYSQVEGDSKRWRFEDYDLPDDSENGWGVSAWKEIVLPELKENE